MKKTFRQLEIAEEFYYQGINLIKTKVIFKGCCIVESNAIDRDGKPYLIRNEAIIETKEQQKQNDTNL